MSETASGKSIEIKDAEGLLILSAIVNSGAASSGSSNAYRKEIPSLKKAVTPWLPFLLFKNPFHLLKCTFRYKIRIVYAKEDSL